MFTVLIVEDDKNLRKLMDIKLKAEGIGISEENVKKI